MSLSKPLLFATMVLAALTFAGAAQAQKSKDTLRIAITEPFRAISPYFYPANEAAPFYRQIYQGLVAHDEYKRKYVPLLAKSWKRISPTVLEFELRDDVTFHNGNKFDADDVVYSLMFPGQPKVKLKFKGRYTWIDSVEKLGKYKVRLKAKKLYAMDLSYLSYRGYIVDAETHKSHKDKSDYGRKTPVGTGSYKVVSFDSREGTVVERYDNFKGRGRAPIKHIHGVYIPDQQTQIGEMLVGNVDMARNLQRDVAEALKKKPDLRVTAVDSLTIGFMLLDAVGRSATKVLTNPKVRRAVMMGVNRKSLIKNVIAGGNVATPTQGYCFKIMRGCDWTVDPVKYDPAGARKLLAEAGYPNGFELKISSHVVVKHLGEAVVGDLRKIGIRATVDVLSTPALRKKRRTGKLQGFVHYYPMGGMPDTGNGLQMYFSGKRDYSKDPLIASMMKKGRGTHDLGARTAFYRQAMDQINKNYYILPISSLPIVYAHSKAVEIKPNLTYAKDVQITDFFWK